MSSTMHYLVLFDSVTGATHDDSITGADAEDGDDD